MHPQKSNSLEEAIETIENLRKLGINDLEYSYMPGIDDLNIFFQTLPKLRPFAKPHLSIFRPAEEGQENLKCQEFKENPIEYLCKMSIAFEKEYGGPIYQNNLASLWGFPIERINPLFLTDKISLG